jgi:hypothetical protein
MSDEQKSTPEWDIFTRIERGEQLIGRIDEEIEAITPTLVDTMVLAIDRISFAFLALVQEHPKYARRLKDVLITMHKRENIDPKLLEILGGWVISPLEQIETLNKPAVSQILFQSAQIQVILKI